ncbi:MAG: PKD domain-containing protein, partial [Bacteroidota bacterium]
HFSPCSNVCLKMWHSSYNLVDGNVMSYGIRCDPGETHARDSACVLIETGSDHNQFLNNDFTHGGDGVFIRPLNRWCSRFNYFYNNDVSFAHNNGFESWSPDNTFEHNTANYCSYGFWLGGSDHTVLIDNEVAYNGTVNANAPEGDFGNAGVAVVAGSSSHFICERNRIYNNGDGSHPASGLAIRYKADYPAFHWIIQKNTITNNSKYGLYYKDAKWLDLAANTITGNTVANIYSGGNVTDLFNRTASMSDLAPIAAATISSTLVSVGTPVTFNASGSTDPNNPSLPLSYRWDLGDGTIETAAQVVHTYATPGFKRVGLTVNNGKVADLAWFDVYVVSTGAETGTEAAASTWGYSLQIPQDHVWLTDDTEFRIKGTKSVKMETDTGFLCHWHYPGAKNANWNLSGATAVSFWMSSRNQNTGGYQINTPTVRLCTNDSNYYEYTPSNGFNASLQYEEGRYGWVYFQVPFAGGSGWTRTVTGSPNLSQINYIQFIGDTWGAGFVIWIDGLEFTTAAPENAGNLALNPWGSGYPSPSASYTSPYDTVWGPLDGTYGATPRWTCWNSMNATDWYAVDFGASKTFGKIKAYFHNDGGGVKPPTSYDIQYWNGSTWVDAANQVKTPTTPAEGLNTVTFTPVTAAKVRIVCTNQDPVSYGVYSGLTEFEVYNQFADDFNDGNATGWTTYGGTWAVESNEYSVNTGYGHKSVANGTSFTNFTFEADVKVSSTASGANGGIIFRVSNPSVGYDTYNGYYVGIYAGDDKVVLGKANGSWTQIAQAAMTIDANVFYHIKVIASGTSIKVYVTDMVNPRIDVTDSSHGSGMIGTRIWNTHAHFDNISVIAN